MNFGKRRGEMQFDFYISEKPNIALRVKVNVIYNIFGDKTYRVNRDPIEANKYILIYTLGGKGCVKPAESIFTLAENDLLLIKPNDYFSYWCEGETWDFWWFEFWSDTLPIALDQKYQVLLTELELGLFKQSLDLLKQDKSNLASSILGGVISLIAAKIEANNPIDSGLSLFYKADHLIQNHLSTLTIAKLSDLVHVSERTLRNIFHTYAHKSPQQYIDEMKFSRTLFMLKNTSMPIGQIALELGYCTPFYFSKAFKKKYGITPSQYRNYFRTLHQ